MSSADDSSLERCLKDSSQHDTEEGYAKRKYRKTCKCLQFLTVLFVIVVLSNIALAGFTYHLYKLYEELSKKVEIQGEAYKMQIHAAPVHAAYIAKQNETTTTGMPVQTTPPTVKPTCPPAVEIKPEGIATKDIAHLYGNSSLIDSFIARQSANDDLILRKSPMAGITGCRDEYVNRKGPGDHYCKTLKYFMISQRERFRALYDYFDKASWMTKNDSNYEILAGGKIRVKSSGMYLVQAHVNFNTEAGASMRLIREGRDQTMETVGGCSTNVDTGGKVEANVLPCSAFQVLQLLEQELLYMDIHTYSVFEVRPETLHITVLKLNGHTF